MSLSIFKLVPTPIFNTPPLAVLNRSFQASLMPNNKGMFLPSRLLYVCGVCVLLGRGFNTD